MKYFILYTLFFFTLAMEGCAQKTKVTTPNGEIETCTEWYKKASFDNAYECLVNLPAQSQSSFYYDLKGSVEAKLEKYVDAETSFRQSIQLDNSDKNVFLYFKLGEVLWSQHKYKQAYSPFNSFAAAGQNLKPDLAQKLDYYLRSADLADSLYQAIRIFDPHPLDTILNSSDDELSVSFTHDHKSIMITRRNQQEDILEARCQDGQWTRPTSINAINTPDNEGGVSLSGDGNRLVFTACNRSDGKGSCDIYLSTKKDGQWQSPFPISNINSRFWDSQPTLSNDGRAMIFSSERPGGLGQRDLWLTVLNSMDEWIIPINLGSNINTSGNEENPFLHTDERSLYFTSDFHPGFGGKDVFLSQRLNGNQWTQPRNLGYPVNSGEDEQGIFVNAKGDRGYFASNKEGNFDLYSFSMDPSNQPNSILLVDLVVLDKDTKSSLANVVVEVVDLATQQIIQKTNTNSEGQFRYLLQKGKKYGINIGKQDYSMTSALVNQLSSNQTDTLYLARIEKINTPIVLENIFFATGKADLEVESNFELNKLLGFLELHPDLSIVILGHTDDIGQKKDNLLLSQLRAESVRKYLMEAGIEAIRMEAKGMGAEQPIADNTTESGRAKNRRTEFLIK